jgi:hypothetical protein
MSNLCEECMRVFSCPKKLRRHLKEQHAAEIPCFVCETCSETFKRVEGLKRHYTAKHLDLKCDCRACPARFVEKYKLKRHYRQAHQLFFCTTCEYISLDASHPEYQNIKKNGDSIAGTASRKASLISENSFDVHSFHQTHKCKEVYHFCKFDDCGKKYKRKALLDQHTFQCHKAVDSGEDLLSRFKKSVSTTSLNTQIHPSPIVLKSDFFKSKNYRKQSSEDIDLTLLLPNSKRHKRMKYLCSHDRCVKVFSTFARYKRHLQSHAKQTKPSN